MNHFLLFPPCLGQIFVWLGLVFESKRRGPVCTEASRSPRSPGGRARVLPCPPRVGISVESHSINGASRLPQNAVISDLICGSVFVSCESGEPTSHVAAFQPVSTPDCGDVKHFAQRRKSTDSYTWIQSLVTEGRPHSGQRFVPTSVLWCPSPHTPVYYTFSQYLKACLGKYQELSGLLAAGNLTPPPQMYHDQQALAKITNQLPGTRLLRTAKRSPRNVSLTPASLYAQPDLRRSNKYTLPPVILRLVGVPYDRQRPQANHR